MAAAAAPPVPLPLPLPLPLPQTQYLAGGGAAGRRAPLAYDGPAMAAARARGAAGAATDARCPYVLWACTGAKAAAGGGRGLVGEVDHAVSRHALQLLADAAATACVPAAAAAAGARRVNLNRAPLARELHAALNAPDNLFAVSHIGHRAKGALFRGFEGALAACLAASAAAGGGGGAAAAPPPFPRLGLHYLEYVTAAPAAAAAAAAAAARRRADDFTASALLAWQMAFCAVAAALEGGAARPGGALTAVDRAVLAFVAARLRALGAPAW